MAHMTPAQIRSELAGLTRMAADAIEALDLYEDTYADEVSHAVSRLLGQIGVLAHALRRAHLAAHERDGEFARTVLGDLERITAGGDPDKHQDWDDFLEDWNSTTQEDET